MTANWELFTKDPRDWEIPNQGVTKVGTPKDEGDWEVLRWELENFVCEGEYAIGLERILNAYLAGLLRPEQTAVWVSGFYGSGKSHLTRMLAELWIDRDMPSGGSARGLTNLSQGVADALIELDIAGKRSGGRWAATGKLGAGVDDSYRLAFLSILFDSARLPTKYPAARFALKLEAEGVYETIVEQLVANGEDPRREFLEMYVSDSLHELVLEHLPQLANDATELKELLRAQYPQVDDVSDDELQIVMQMVLEGQSADGTIPLTVIVLDEVQQYVGDDDDRLDNVQNITEMVSKSFDSRVMIVGTGQSALAGNPLLSKIQHRFLTKVELSDRDVEEVTRELVLRKKPEMKDELSEVLDGVSGKINSQLVGTRIAAKPQDTAALPLDYPVLPVRRRLWEKMLRAIDVSGGTGQLRTQLRMTHEANQKVADLDVPSAIGADYIYFDQAQGMLSGNVLSQDMHQRIIDCDDGTDEGQLKQRVLALVFMISQLPREAGADIEVRAKPDTLAELLVTDLTTESGIVKDKVEDALEALVDDGALVQIDSEYSLQTPAGAELQRKFRERIQRVSNSAAEMSSLRNETLKEAVNRDLANMTKNQGAAQVQRKVAVQLGGEQPNVAGTQLPVWVQTEWSVSGKSVEDAARVGGIEDSTVYVFLPKVDAPGFDDALARVKAADLVLSGEPAADTPESREARRSLEAERESARTDVSRRSGDILAAAVVRQGGGTEVDPVGGLRGTVDKALDTALLRRFPRFSDGDHAEWEKVAKRAREGNLKAIEAVGYTGKVESHAVPKAILTFLPPSKTGAQVRDHFKGGDYGWSQDAVDGGLLALVAAGYVEAKDARQRNVDTKAIGTRDINSTTFEPVETVIGVDDRLAVKGLLSDLGISVDGSAYNESIGRMIERFEQISTSLTGPEPLPDSYDMSSVEEVSRYSGNEAMRALLEQADDLRSFHDRLADLSGILEQRKIQWDLLERLRHHAAGTSIGAEHFEALEAINAGRQILDTPDPVAPISQTYIDGFRDAVEEHRGVHAARVEEARNRIMASVDWATVGPDVGEPVLQTSELLALAEPKLDTALDVVGALDSVPLTAWQTRIDAVPTREAQAMHAIAQFAQPKVKVIAVNLPSRVIRSTEDIDTYVDDVRSALEANFGDETHLSV